MMEVHAHYQHVHPLAGVCPSRRRRCRFDICGKRLQTVDLRQLRELRLAYQRGEERATQRLLGGETFPASVLEERLVDRLLRRSGGEEEEEEEYEVVIAWQQAREAQAGTEALQAVDEVRRRRRRRVKEMRLGWCLSVLLFLFVCVSLLLSALRSSLCSPIFFLIPRAVTPSFISSSLPLTSVSQGLPSFLIFLRFSLTLTPHVRKPSPSLLLCYLLAS